MKNGTNGKTPIFVCLLQTEDETVDFVCLLQTEDGNGKLPFVCCKLKTERGLLDRSTARYFYKRHKTSLHKLTENLIENLFYKKMLI